jgi:hypothetical protein
MDIYTDVQIKCRSPKLPGDRPTAEKYDIIRSTIHHIDYLVYQ